MNEVSKKNENKQYKIKIDDNWIDLQGSPEMYVYTNENLSNQAWLLFDFKFWVKSQEWVRKYIQKSHVACINIQDSIFRFKVSKLDDIKSFKELFDKFDKSYQEYVPKSEITKDFKLYCIDNTNELLYETTYLNFMPIYVDLDGNIKGLCDWLVFEDFKNN